MHGEGGNTTAASLTARHPVCIGAHWRQIQRMSLQLEHE